MPGPEIRVTEGQRLRVRLENLPEPTTVHWHGLPVPSAMDGVPDVSQRAVQPGETFTYEFDVPASGTLAPPTTAIYCTAVRALRQRP